MSRRTVWLLALLLCAVPEAVALCLFGPQAALYVLGVYGLAGVAVSVTAGAVGRRRRRGQAAVRSGYPDWDS